MVTAFYPEGDFLFTFRLPIKEGRWRFPGEKPPSQQKEKGGRILSLILLLSVCVPTASKPSSRISYVPIADTTTGAR